MILTHYYAIVILVYFSTHFIFVIGLERHGDNIPFIVLNGTLLFTAPISTRFSFSGVDSHGYLLKFMDPCFKTFSLDVGINRGKVIQKDWLEPIPYLCAIGIDANYHLVSHFEQSDSTRSVRNRSLVIHAAVASKRSTVAEFNTGAGWNDVPDTGSLFKWIDKRREQVRLAKREQSSQVARFIRLDDILQHVPPPRIFPDRDEFIWDTLKVDIQGSDADALLSAGEYVARFVCVVGEFKSDHYDVPNDLLQDPSSLLRRFNYTQVLKGSQNQIWINRKYASIYLENATRFCCHRVYDSSIDASRLQEALRENKIIYI